jgi:hypothetical protein
LGQQLLERVTAARLRFDDQTAAIDEQGNRGSGSQVQHVENGRRNGEHYRAADFAQTGRVQWIPPRLYLDITSLGLIGKPWPHFAVRDSTEFPIPFANSADSLRHMEDIAMAGLSLRLDAALMVPVATPHRSTGGSPKWRSRAPRASAMVAVVSDAWGWTLARLSVPVRRAAVRSPGD